MAQKVRKLIATTLLFLALTLCFIQLPKAQSQTNVDTTIVLDFLRDVVQLDLTRYNITSITPYTLMWEGLPQTHGKYTLINGTNRIDALFTFTNYTLRECSMAAYGESPQFAQQQFSDILVTAKGLLQRYKSFTGDNNLEPLLNLLTNVDSIANANKTSLDAKIETHANSMSSYIILNRVINGVPYVGVTIGFFNGIFRSIIDRTYVKISGAPLVISKDQAVQVALGTAQVPSWANAIVYDQIHVGLFTKSRESTLVQYPFWIVELPLSGNYDAQTHGGVITVEIWADTAEIIKTYMGTGFIGEPYVTATPSPNQTQTTSHSQSPQASSTTLSTTAPSIQPTPSPSSTVPSPTITPTEFPTQTPILEPTQTPDRPKIGDFAPVLIPAGIILLVMVAVGLLFYFRKRRG